MPEKLKNTNVNYSTMSTSDIVNTVRAETAAGNSYSGINFEERIPQCVKDNINQIGDIFFDNGDLANAFLKEILNRIGLVDMNYRRYYNNLKELKQGKLEYGDTVEEIAFGLVKAKCDYKVEDGVNDVFAITRPEVASALHKVNMQVKYPGTITRRELRKAFTSERSLGSFIDGIITALYNSYEVDEQILYKKLVRDSVSKGFFKMVDVKPLDSEANAKAFIKTIKALSTKMRFMSKDYSKYGLPQFTPESEMIVIIDAETDAEITVDVWAAAFNMSEVEFIRSGRKIVIDDFGVEGLRAIIADERFFQIYDYEFAMDTMYNGSNGATNYWLHVWEVISASPFMQGVALVEEGSGTVTGITITPDSITAKKGNQYKFDSVVTGTGLFNGRTAWSVAGSTPDDSGTYINADGILTVGENETAASLTVTGAAVYGTDINATATVTVTQ